MYAYVNTCTRRHTTKPRAPINHTTKPREITQAARETNKSYNTAPNPKRFSDRAPNLWKHTAQQAIQRNPTKQNKTQGITQCNIMETCNPTTNPKPNKFKTLEVQHKRARRRANPKASELVFVIPLARNIRPPAHCMIMPTRLEKMQSKSCTKQFRSDSSPKPWRNTCPS